MLSEVKQKILDLLKNKEWVSSKELLKKTNQKYFDRRIRELRDENGYDIIVQHINGEPHYKLQSNKINPLKHRTYLSKKDRDEIKKNSSNTCPLCNRTYNSIIKPAYDHRVPLIKGGNGKVDNFQIICYECNNQKRSQCRHCDMDCNKCFLAFPEKSNPSILLNFVDIENYNFIKRKAEENGLSLSEYIESIIRTKRASLLT